MTLTERVKSTAKMSVFKSPAWCGERRVWGLGGWEDLNGRNPGRPRWTRNPPRDSANGGSAHGFAELAWVLQNVAALFAKGQ
jgi:hypothetical protein